MSTQPDSSTAPRHDIEADTGSTIWFLWDSPAQQRQWTSEHTLQAHVTPSAAFMCTYAVLSLCRHSAVPQTHGAVHIRGGDAFQLCILCVYVAVSDRCSVGGELACVEDDGGDHDGQEAQHALDLLHLRHRVQPLLPAAGLLRASPGRGLVQTPADSANSSRVGSVPVLNPPLLPPLLSHFPLRVMVA